MVLGLVCCLPSCSCVCQALYSRPAAKECSNCGAAWPAIDADKLPAALPAPACLQSHLPDTAHLLLADISMAGIYERTPIGPMLQVPALPCIPATARLLFRPWLMAAVEM